jgi:hypothetical protein
MVALLINTIPEKCSECPLFKDTDFGYECGFDDLPKGFDPYAKGRNKDCQLVLIPNVVEIQ